MILPILIFSAVFILIIICFSYIKNFNRSTSEKITDNSIQDKNIIEHYIKALVEDSELEKIKNRIEVLETYLKEKTDLIKKNIDETNNILFNNNEIKNIDIEEKQITIEPTIEPTIETINEPIEELNENIESILSREDNILKEKDKKKKRKYEK